MSKKIIRLLTLVLALAMVFGLAACGNSTPADTTPADNTPADTTPEVNPDADKLAVEVWDYDPANYYDDSAEVYDAILGGYYENYEAALAAKSIAERFAHRFPEPDPENRVSGIGIDPDSAMERGPEIQNHASARMQNRRLRSIMNHSLEIHIAGQLFRILGFLREKQFFRRTIEPRPRVTIK